MIARRSLLVALVGLPVTLRTLNRTKRSGYSRGYTKGY